MHLLKSHRLSYTFLGATLLLFATLRHTEEITYLQTPTIPFHWDSLQVDTISFHDTLLARTLYQFRSSENLIPLFYAQAITTDVCFDNKCRPLKATIFWNITGRYLGFKLPKGEFLSKHEHEPFSGSEYEKLNKLLADPNLPFGNLPFEKLIVQPPTKSDPVDAISGATTSDLSSMVVKGAAYTTYTLWNIVHGSTKDLVTSLTEKQLSPELIDLILQSPDISDRLWALNRINQRIKLTPKLMATLLHMISGEDFSLAYSTINALKASHLNDTLQTALFSNYKNLGHSIQRMIVGKLMEAPYLSAHVITRSRNLLPRLNGKQLSDILKLYTKHAVNDLQTYQAVAAQLKNENKFISRQAYNFLKNIPASDPEIKQLLTDYEQKDNQ